MTVSVLLQTYNHERYISKCIQGILSQIVDFDIQIVIGDDCSTDNTQSIILEEVAKNSDKHKIIELQLNSKNLSPELPGKANFMKLYESAKGKYIIIIDGDDYWTDSFKLQKQVDYLEKNNDCTGVFHPADWLIQNTGDIIPKRYKPKHIKSKYNLKDILNENGNPIPTCSALFVNRKTILPEWFKTVPYGDFAIHLINLSIGKYGYLNESMAVYREHSGGDFSKHSKYKNLLKDIDFYILVGKELSLSNLKEFKKVLFKKYLNIYVIGRKNHLKEKRQYMLMTIRYASISDFKTIVRKVFPRIWNLYNQFKYYYGRLKYYLLKPLK